MRGPGDHDFEARAAGGEYTRARFDVVHEVRTENAHLERVKARVLQAARIRGLILDRNLRLVRIAAPYRCDVNRDAGSRSAQHPVYRLACDLADRVPHRLLNPAPVEQSSLY